MARHAPFVTPTILNKSGPRYIKDGDTHPLVASSTSFTGKPSQAVIMTPNEGQHENMGWRLKECEIYGQRVWQPKHHRMRVEPVWGMRAYMMSDLRIEKTHFRSAFKEHDFYVDCDFEHGDVVLDGNYFQDAMSQAIQIVGPWSRPYNSGWPQRAENAGELYITANLIVNCGRWNYWAAQGISRPSFALSVFKAVRRLKCFVHGNHLKSVGKKQPDGSYSYGAMMFERTRYLEVMNNLVEYKQPSNRDVLLFDGVDELVAEGNQIMGGHVHFDLPNEVIWQGNQGWGSVKWTDASGKTKFLGDVTGTYVFQQGQPVTVKP